MSSESDSDSENRTERESKLLHPLLDGKYFKIIKRTENLVFCKCALCNAELKAQVNPTTNLALHVKVCIILYTYSTLFWIYIDNFMLNWSVFALL